jgi:hypothetical protein
MHRPVDHAGSTPRIHHQCGRHRHAVAPASALVGVTRGSGWCGRQTSAEQQSRPRCDVRGRLWLRRWQRPDQRSRRRARAQRPPAARATKLARPPPAGARTRDAVLKTATARGGCWGSRCRRPLHLSGARLRAAVSRWGAQPQRASRRRSGVFRSVAPPWHATLLRS